jgi:hypothetical protein
MMQPGEWLDETVFLLGGGPTLTAEIAARIHGRKTIAINSTSRIAPWADVLFFADFTWFREHRPIVDNWPGGVLTISRRAHRLGRAGKVQLLNPPAVRIANLSAGHHAVDVALWLGAKTIVLLGFDCRLVDGRSHNHDDYGNHNARLYTDVVLPAWADYPERASRRRATILNATPGSAIEVFPKSDLTKILEGDR